MTYSWSQRHVSLVRCQMSFVPSPLQYASAFWPPDVSCQRCAKWVSPSRMSESASTAVGGTGRNGDAAGAAAARATSAAAARRASRAAVRCTSVAFRLETIRAGAGTALRYISGSPSQGGDEVDFLSRPLHGDPNV